MYKTNSPGGDIQTFDSLCCLQELYVKISKRQENGSQPLSCHFEHPKTFTAFQTYEDSDRIL